MGVRDRVLAVFWDDICRLSRAIKSLFVTKQSYTLLESLSAPYAFRHITSKRMDNFAKAVPFLRTDQAVFAARAIRAEAAGLESMVVCSEIKRLYTKEFKDIITDIESFLRANKQTIIDAGKI